MLKKKNLIMEEVEIFDKISFSFVIERNILNGLEDDGFFLQQKKHQEYGWVMSKWEVE